MSAGCDRLLALKWFKRCLQLEILLHIADSLSRINTGASCLHLRAGNEVLVAGDGEGGVCALASTGRCDQLGGNLVKDVTGSSEQNVRLELQGDCDNLWSSVRSASGAHRSTSAIYRRLMWILHFCSEGP